MSFWIFMLIMDLLIPVTMIGFGAYFRKRAPREINAVFGYRTARSMRSHEAWELAHRVCGTIWLWGGRGTPAFDDRGIPALARERRSGSWRMGRTHLLCANRTHDRHRYPG